MGSWDRGANWNRDMLERIVALLVALAGLVDLTAGLPVLRRRQELGILSHGEAEARAFLIGIATGGPVDALEQAHDAAGLAVRFRALALLLCAVLEQAPLSALRAAVSPRACLPSRKIYGPAVRWLDAEASPAPDT